jgi:hypothetical protein
MESRFGKVLSVKEQLLEEAIMRPKSLKRKDEEYTAKECVDSKKRSCPAVMSKRKEYKKIRRGELRKDSK